jgi:Integrase core domain
MPYQAPNANAHAERFVRSIRGECLDRLILFGERRLLRVLKELVVHYHNERNHQGLGNDLIAAPRAVSRAGIRYHDRLGGPCPLQVVFIMSSGEPASVDATPVP